MERKILSFVLAVIIALSVVPMSVFATGIYPESSHPYEDGCDNTWEYSASTKAKSLTITFDDRCKTEKYCDFVMIYNGENELKYSFDGTSMAGETISLNGNKFKIRLTSDGSCTYYGFKISNIVENNFTVAEPDNQPLEPAAKKPTQLNSDYVANFDGDVYILSESSPQRVLENHSVMESVYLGRYYQASYYMISEDSALWEVVIGDYTWDVNASRIGEGFKSLGKNFAFLALDNGGKCYDLENNKMIAKDIVEVDGRYLLSSAGRLYYADYNGSVHFCSSGIKEIVETTWWSDCYAVKDDGSTCIVNYLYDNDETKISNHSFNQVAVYAGSYYFTDSDSRLWKCRYDYDTGAITEKIVDYNVKSIDVDKYRNPIGYVKNNNNLILFNKMVEGASTTPFATNIQKVGANCYLTNDRELYVCFGRAEDKRNLSVLSSEGKIVRVMTNVADFIDIDYDNIIFTRTDGSVWTYEAGIAKKVLSPSNDGKEGILAQHNLTLQYRSSASLSARIFEGETVKWESYDTNVVSVDNSGVVTSEKRMGISPGYATVVLEVIDPSGYIYSDYCEITIEYTWWQWLIKIVLFGWLWY